jgi:predicted  nucleic acid-binding Zn ribbon protein
MHTAQLDLRTKKAQGLEISEALTELLACWFKNGQIAISPSPFAQRTTKHLQAFVALPADDALSTKHDSVYATAALAKLRELNAELKITPLGNDPDSLAPCACKRRRSLIMYTHYLSTESPLRCGDCFMPVPLYQVPITHDHERFDWRAWMTGYQACDRLQMGCAVGERYHENQLYKVDSELTKVGLGLRAKLAQLSKRPVYYFLYKARGVSKAKEYERPCPACAKPWRLAKPWHFFDFCCESCGLVSRVASTLAR